MNALSVAFKDLQMLLKDRGQIVLLFLVPIGFILAFSAAFAAGQQLEEEVIVVPVVNLDPGSEMSVLLLKNLNADRGLQTEDYDQAKAEADLKDETIKMALTIPAGFGTDVQASTQTTLRLMYGPAASNSEVEAVRLVVDGAASDLSLETQLVDGLSQMGAMMGDAPPDVQAFTAEQIKVQAERQFERSKDTPLVALSAKWPDQITQGRDDFEPSTFGVAGFAVMFAFLTAQVTASSIFDEKKEGTFRRLLAAPMGRWELLAGKMLPNFFLAILQVVVVVAASMVLLPLIGQEVPSLGNSPLGLILITILVGPVFHEPGRPAGRLVSHRESGGWRQHPFSVGGRHGRWGLYPRLCPRRFSQCHRQDGAPLLGVASLQRLDNPWPWRRRHPARAWHPGWLHGGVLCDWLAQVQV